MSDSPSAKQLSALSFLHEEGIARRKPLWLCNFGYQPFFYLWQLQQELVAARGSDLIPDVLLFGEHPSVITLGKASEKEMPLWAKTSPTPVYHIERGGKATWHGPGQLVVYPIFKLRQQARATVLLLRWLELLGQITLQHFNLNAVNHPKESGVWVKPPSGQEPTGQLLKIGSVGLAVKHWVSYHGLSLNICPNRAQYSFVPACGLSYSSYSSIAELCQGFISKEQLGKPCSDGLLQARSTLLLALQSAEPEFELKTASLAAIKSYLLGGRLCTVVAGANHNAGIPAMPALS